MGVEVGGTSWYKSPRKTKAPQVSTTKIASGGKLRPDQSPRTLQAPADAASDALAAAPPGDVERRNDASISGPPTDPYRPLGACVDNQMRHAPIQIVAVARSGRPRGRPGVIDRHRSRPPRSADATGDPDRLALARAVVAHTSVIEAPVVYGGSTRTRGSLQRLWRAGRDDLGLRGGRRRL